MSTKVIGEPGRDKKVSPIVLSHMDCFAQSIDLSATRSESSKANPFQTLRRSGFAEQREVLSTLLGQEALSVDNFLGLK
jgi:hypothetical protein